MSLEAGKFYVGHLGRVPIYVAVEALILLLFVYQATPPNAGVQIYLLSVLALLMTILLHELGHATVAIATGMSGVSVTIGALGGYCSYTGDRAPKRALPITLAGVSVNFLLWWLTVILRPVVESTHMPLLGAFVWLFGFWNMLSAIFNVLPIYPLDGGQAVLLIAQMASRRESSARRFTLALTIAAALAVLVWFARIGGLGGWNLLLLAVLLMQAFRDLR